MMLFSVSQNAVILIQEIFNFSSDGSLSFTPSGYNTSAHKSFNSTAMEDLNRTWPSATISDVSSKDSHLVSPGSPISVSATKSHFELMSKIR